MMKLGKVKTAILPTPLHKLENISKDLKDYNIYIKRDDLTGLGLGGNKLRKLDYLVKKALDEGYTTLLTYGGIQTNHGRLTAAAAAKFGLKSIIMVYGNPPRRISGNLLLDKIIGSEIIYMDTTDIRANMNDKTQEVIVKEYQTLKEKCTLSTIKRYELLGEKVFTIPIGGHSKEGLLGYFDCIEEINYQLINQDLSIDYLVVGNGSGGTLGGLLLGSKYYNVPYKIMASNVSEKSEKDMNNLINFCNQTSDYFNMNVEVSLDDFYYTNKYVGIGYNLPDKHTRETIQYLAQKEGLFIDPCYTGKAFMGLLGMIDEGLFKKGSNILFIHTGGLPGLWTEEHEDGFNEDFKI